MANEEKLSFCAPKNIHKALQQWSLVYHRSYSRLIRALLTLTPWSIDGAVIYQIAIPQREHKSAESLRAALDTACDAIMQEWEMSGRVGERPPADVERWSNDKRLSGRVDIKPPPSPDNTNGG